MKQKVLSITFKSNGQEIPQLSKTPASSEQVLAALHFIGENDEISLCVKEIEVQTSVPTHYE